MLPIAPARAGFGLKGTAGEHTWAAGSMALQENATAAPPPLLKRTARAKGLGLYAGAVFDAIRAGALRTQCVPALALCAPLSCWRDGFLGVLPVGLGPRTRPR